jgi:2'-5' RNA ligase
MAAIADPAAVCAALGPLLLDERRARIDEAAAALDFKREARAFSPHVTLGRVRQPHAQPRFGEALAATRVVGTVEVARVSLMRSDLSPRGARYTELATARLGPVASG